MLARTERTITASPDGLKTLQDKRKFSSKTAEIIGDLAGVSRSTAQKFFRGQGISVENFQALCKVLDVNWEEIVGLETASSGCDRKRVAFVINGSLDDLDPTKLAKLQAMVKSIQQLTGDASMITVDIEEGSIRLIMEGSEEGIERLKQLFEEEELTNVLGTEVIEIEPIESDRLITKEVEEDYLKNLLVTKIRSQGASEADLSNADLSGSNLQNADLSGSNLQNADLSGSNLQNADLSDKPRDLNNDLNNARDLVRVINRVRDLNNARVINRVINNTQVLVDLDLDLDSDFDRVDDRDLVLNRVRGNILITLITRILNRARARDLVLNRILNRARVLVRVLVRALDNARNRDNARALDLIRDNVLDLNLVLNRDRDNARAWDLHFDLFLALNKKTNLSNSNFSGADISGADLRGIDLSSANLSGTIVEGTLFGQGIGLTEAQKRDLEQQGAIFDEAMGDREFVLR